MNIQNLVREALDEACASYKPEDLLGKLINFMHREFDIPLDEIYAKVPANLAGRSPGFHASLSGMCHRRVITEVLNKGFTAVEVDAESQRIFTIGNMIHEFLDQAMTKRVWRENGRLMVLQATRLVSFEDKASGFRVVGTPDVVLLNLETSSIIVVDGKTVNSRGMDYKTSKKNPGGAEEVSIHHALQVGTYIAALRQQFETSPIGRTLSLAREIISKAGSDLGATDPEDIPMAQFNYQGYVAYMGKDKLNSLVPYAGDEVLISRAANYWEGVKQAWLLAQKVGRMPAADPPQAWQCGYCPLHEHIYTSPDAKKKHALAKCQMLTDTDLLGKSHPGILQLDSHSKAKELLG